MLSQILQPDVCNGRHVSDGLPVRCLLMFQDGADSVSFAEKVYSDETPEQAAGKIGSGADTLARWKTAEDEKFRSWKARRIVG